MNSDRIHLINGLALDLARGCLARSGEPVHLRPQSYEVLKYLVEHQGRLISKDKLIEEIWKGRAVTDGSLGKCIEEVRDALGPEARQYVRNVRGRGYIFDLGARPEGETLAATSEQIDVLRVVIEDEEELPNEFVTMRASLSAPVAHAGPDWNRILTRSTFVVIGLVAISLVAAIIYSFFFGRTINSAAIKSIAVLPFQNESGNSDVEYLADGMTESLINNLSQIPQVLVKARSTVFRYKDKTISPQQVASELSVQAILNGRLVQRGDDLILYLSLIDGSNGNQIWGEQYNRKLTDLVTLQTDIAHDVSHKLRAQLSPAEEQKLVKNYTANKEAYELYLKGRYHHLKLTLPEIRKGIGFYQQAIDADPTYALAYAGLAAAYRTLAIAGWGVPSKEAYPQSKAAARHALEIDPDLAAAHDALGWAEFSFDWDWKAAESEFNKAIELSPNDAGAHLGSAHLFSILGRGEEAIAEAKRARELDPLWLIANALEGQFLFYAGHNDEAIARFKKTLEIDPNFWVAHNGLARVYILQGRYEDAIATLRKAIEVSGGSNEPMTQLGYVLAKSGKPQEARAILAQLNSLATQRYVPAYSFAMIYNGLGEREEALRYLEKSLEEREVQITFIKIDTRWDDFRAHPRFQEIMRRVGLPT